MVSITRAVATDLLAEGEAEPIGHDAPDAGTERIAGEQLEHPLSLQRADASTAHDAAKESNLPSRGLPGPASFEDLQAWH